jgi:High potential iron-sulfur protein
VYLLLIKDERGLHFVMDGDQCLHVKTTQHYPFANITKSSPKDLDYMKHSSTKSIKVCAISSSLKNKYTNHSDEQRCSGCQLFSGKATDATAACAVFSGKHVAGIGWCSAHAKKAA